MVLENSARPRSSAFLSWGALSSEWRGRHGGGRVPPGNRNYSRKGRFSRRFGNCLIGGEQVQGCPSCLAKSIGPRSWEPVSPLQALSGSAAFPTESGSITRTRGDCPPREGRS